MDLSKHLKMLNNEQTMGIVFLKDGKFDPNKFCGEKFTKLKNEIYKASDEGKN